AATTAPAHGLGRSVAATSAATAATLAARCGAGAAQRGDAARRLFVVADRENPILRRIGAVDADRLRIQALVAGRPAAVDQIADCDRFRPAHDDVVAARAHGIAGLDHDRATAAVVADAADDLEAAGDAGADEVTVVQPVLVDHVVFETIEIVLGQQLSGKE